MIRILALSIVVLAGCHREAGPELFGPEVAPPDILARVRLGMTVAAVQALAPDAEMDPKRNALLLAQPASNVRLYAGISDGFVDKAYAMIDGDALDLLTRAWGAPDAEHDREDHLRVAWRSTRTGWRAALRCYQTACEVSFHPHRPLEAMLEHAVHPPGDLAQIRPRAPVTALASLRPLSSKPNQATTRYADYDGAVEDLGILQSRLYYIIYTLPADAHAMLERAWGKPVTVGDYEMWSDAKTGWSALASKATDGVRLEFVGYTPFEQELELMETLAKMRTLDEARRALPDLEWHDVNQSHAAALHTSGHELLEPVWRSQPFNIISVFEGHSTLLVGQTYLDAAKTAGLVDLLTKRWGPPKTDGRGDDRHYVFPGHGFVIRHKDGVSLQVATST